MRTRSSSARRLEAPSGVTPVGVSSPAPGPQQHQQQQQPPAQAPHDPAPPAVPGAHIAIDARDLLAAATIDAARLGGPVPGSHQHHHCNHVLQAPTHRSPRAAVPPGVPDAAPPGDGPVQLHRHHMLQPASLGAPEHCSQQQQHVQHHMQPPAAPPAQGLHEAALEPVSPLWCGAAHAQRALCVARRARCAVQAASAQAVWAPSVLACPSLALLPTPPPPHPHPDPSNGRRLCFADSCPSSSWRCMCEPARALCELASRRRAPPGLRSGVAKLANGLCAVDGPPPPTQCSASWFALGPLSVVRPMLGSVARWEVSSWNVTWMSLWCGSFWVLAFAPPKDKSTAVACTGSTGLSVGTQGVPADTTHETPLTKNKKTLRPLD
jgi:hypothetical protein